MSFGCDLDLRGSEHGSVAAGSQQLSYIFVDSQGEESGLSGLPGTTCSQNTTHCPLKMNRPTEFTALSAYPASYWLHFIKQMFNYFRRLNQILFYKTQVLNTGRVLSL